VRGRGRSVLLLNAGRVAPACSSSRCPPRAADEANKLMAWADKADVQELFDFFVVVTKQDNLAHVVLATSDSFFFMSWLGKRTWLRQRRCAASAPRWTARHWGASSAVPCAAAG
jgi:hypothetical protein